MNIQLKKLTAKNFKGGNFEINFNHTTEISGRNASGKTRVFDSYLWLLFGKDSNDTKDFSIKNTVDTSLNRNDHEVIGVLDVDGSEVVLKRVFKEKWTTKRGSPVAEFTGNETVYFYNDVPCSQNDYNRKVDGIISETISKLITNPFAFNALKWEQRREVLTKIAGDVNDSDISAGNSDFGALLTMLNGKTLSDFKKEVAAKKKKIKETKDLIPARIDESSRSRPEKKDFDFIEKSLANKRGLIEKIDLAINDKVKAHREASVAIIQKQNDLNRLKMELQNLEADAKRESQKEIREVETKISAAELDIKRAKASIDSHNAEIPFLKSKIENLNTENEKLREDWRVLNNEKLPEMAADATVCPACSQSLPEDKIESIKADYEKNWNNDKAKKLSAIKGNGDSNVNVIDAYKREIVEHEEAVRDAEISIVKLNVIVDNLQNKRNALLKPTQEVKESAEITSLKTQIESFEIPAIPVVDDAELKQRKQVLQTEINDLIIKLTAKEQIEKINTRIAELEKQERELGQEIADLERTEFTIDKFVKCKMDLIEAKVNQLFTNVSFKMFSKNINGGIEACCDCFYKGVPFVDANNAGRINAGLEIINVLSGFYSCYAPVWVDNAESVNEIYPLASQLITLVVTTESLKIS